MGAYTEICAECLCGFLPENVAEYQRDQDDYFEFPKFCKPCLSTILNEEIEVRQRKLFELGEIR